MTTNTKGCMAAQVRTAINNGEPQPFQEIAEVSEYFEPIGNYVSLFEDGSILFWGDYFVWSPETVKEHENWPAFEVIMTCWQYANEEKRALAPYDEA